LQTILDVYNCFTCIVSLYRNGVGSLRYNDTIQVKQL
jgi:hypothetical protein